MQTYNLQSGFKLSAPPVDAAADSSESANAFEGVGYTGDVTNLYGDSYVFDLSSTTTKPTLPALINHDPNQRAGVIDQIAISSDLKISGKFLPNDHGKSVQMESLHGFPWQMSIGIQPRSVERLETGQTIVNGRTINAPAYICRNNQITEISFVPVGADINTTAHALSADGAENNHKEKQIMSESAPDYAVQLATMRAELTAAKNELKESKDAARKASIAQLKASAGVELTAAREAMLLALDDATYLDVSAMIGDAAKKAPTSNLGKEFDLDDKNTDKHALSGDALLLSVAKGAK